LVIRRPAECHSAKQQITNLRYSGRLRFSVAVSRCTRINAASFSFVLAACAVAQPLPTNTDVFISGKDGYHTYRIPAIEAAPDGSLLAFAEARKNNQSDPGSAKQEIDLVCKRSSDNGATWSSTNVLERAGELWS